MSFVTVLPSSNLTIPKPLNPADVALTSIMAGNLKVYELEPPPSD